MSDVFNSNQSKLWLCDDYTGDEPNPATEPGANFTEVWGATEIQIPEQGHTRKDSTRIRSTRPESVAGMATRSDLTFRLLLDPSDAQHQILKALARNKGEALFAVTRSNANSNTYRCRGAVPGWKEGAYTSDALIEVDVTVTPIGEDYDDLAGINALPA